MTLIIACAAVVAAFLIAPRLLVALLAIFFSAVGFARSRRVTAELLADRSIRYDLNYDRRPSRRERRLMRKSLHLALNQTELRSLFPSTIAVVEGSVSSVG